MLYTSILIGCMGIVWVLGHDDNNAWSSRMSWANLQQGNWKLLNSWKIMRRNLWLSTLWNINRVRSSWLAGEVIKTYLQTTSNHRPSWLGWQTQFLQLLHCRAISACSQYSQWILIRLITCCPFVFISIVKL